MTTFSIKSWACVGALALALAACGQSGEMAESVETLDIEAEAMAPMEEAADVAAETAGEVDPPSDGIEPDTAVAAPQIAYRYELGFRLPAEAIKPLQERHADLCEARGPNVCRIIAMRQADSDGDYAYGNLQIAVAAGVAREFSKQIEASSGNSDAELISSSIEGEDLSKQIVDTEARLRARTLLRDRLMEILRTNKGSVEELVEAERGVAQVNQEIDQARSWLNEMRGRVSFSQMNIAYESGSRSAGSFTDPIRTAWNSLGTVFGSVIAFLMLALAILAPLGIVGYAGLRLWRWAKERGAQ